MSGITRRLFLLIAAAFVAASCGSDAGAPAERATGIPTSSTDVTLADVVTTPTTTTETPEIAVTTSAPVVAGVDTCPTPSPRRTAAADRPVYDVAMRVDPATGVVQGTQAVAFTPDLPVDTLVFRLWANGPRLRSVGTSIEVTDVRETTAGSVARATRRPDATTLVIDLGRWVAPGERVTVTMSWRLVVDGPVNDRISRQSSSLRLGSFVPLLAWEQGVGWATEAPTSGFAESTTSPTADWTVRIDPPDDFDVVASGIETSPGIWTAERSRDIAVAVGRFTTVEATANAPHPVAVTVSVHDGVDDPNAYLGQVVSQLETIAGWYGPYAWDTYQLSITPDLSGGIEYPMHVMQGPSTNGRTTPHEVAHMWFYGLVGNNQGRDPWLDEGLATWVEGRIQGTLPSMRDRSIPAAGRGQAFRPMSFWESRSSAYYRSVYVQPAAALARLADAAGGVGLVDCALAFYVARTAEGIATSEDFAAAFDATFGSTDWRAILAPAGLPTGV